MQGTINPSGTSVVSLILLVLVERFDHYGDTNGSTIVKMIHAKDLQTTRFSIYVSHLTSTCFLVFRTVWNSSNHEDFSNSGRIYSSSHCPRRSWNSS
jgi:hypothetical protein